VSKSTSKPVAELFKVTLNKPHTHGDKDLAAGATIEVTAPEREFLLAAGVIEKQPNAAADAAATQ